MTLRHNLCIILFLMVLFKPFDSAHQESGFLKNLYYVHIYAFVFSNALVIFLICA